MRRQKLVTVAAILVCAMGSSIAWALRSGSLPIPAGHAAGPGASEVSIWLVDEAIAELDLSEAQAAAIEGIRSESADRIRRLETAIADMRSALRAVEEAAVFDEAMAGNLIRQQAEIAAYLWGTRTRIASDVYRILTPEQRLALSTLRSQQEGLRQEGPEWRDRRGR